MSYREPSEVWIAPNGEVYRLSRAGIDSMTDEYQENYDVLTIDGAQTKRYALPEGSLLVWTPTRGLVELQ